MNSKLSIALFVASITLILSPKTSRASLADDLKPYLTKGTFSGVVSIACENHPTYVESFGYCNRGLGIHCTPQTKFRIGSLSKSFTAALLLKLEEEGRVQITDPASRWLPEYPVEHLTDHGTTVTLTHLLHHTSGLPDLEGSRAFLQRVWVSLIRLPEFVGFLDDRPLQAEPGTVFKYSNGGYNLAALIATRAARTPDFEALLKKEILGPAGLSQTGIRLPYQAGLAKGYVFSGGQWGSLYDLPTFLDRDLTLGQGAGSLYSTVADLQRWIQVLSKGALLRSESRARMFDFGLGNYGMGWMKAPLGSGIAYWHNGAVSPAGFYSEAGFSPDGNKSLVILTNIDMTTIDKAAIQVIYREFARQCEIH